MRRGVTWLFMLLKRQLKKISLYVIIFCMIGSTCFVRHMAVNFGVSIKIGVMNEGETGTEGTEEMYRYDTETADRIIELLTGHRGLVRFVEYDSEEIMEKDVRTSEIYAGYIFDKDFWKKVRDDNLKDSIKVISAKDSIVSKITNELVFAYVMEEYAYDVLFYDTCDTGYFDQEDREKIAEDLRKYYEDNLTNGSTFSVVYRGGKESDNRIEMNVFDYISPVVKGITGVLIFLAGLCGTLLLYQDKDNGTFSRFTVMQTAVISFVEIWIPVFLTGITGMICMILAGLYSGSPAEWGHMAAYLILVTLYCMVLRGIIRNRIAFLAMIPVFMMASLLFCHVFINLNTIVPEFKYISMLLPPYYF